MSLGTVGNLRFTRLGCRDLRESAGSTYWVPNACRVQYAAIGEGMLPRTNGLLHLPTSIRCWTKTTITLFLNEAQRSS